MGLSRHLHGDHIKYLKVAAIAWGFIYFAMGALKSFTLNSIDVWSSVALLVAMFLLPLPIAIIAVWFPRIAGTTLLLCIAISVAAVVPIVVAHGASHPGDIGTLVANIAIYDIPHFVFGVALIMTGRASQNSSGQKPTFGAA